jgi:hypothetical protein
VTPEEAINGLDDVPWAEMGGPEIPDYLRTVAAGVGPDEDDDEYQEALYLLQSEVVAGGVVFEASSHLMPFLARLAVADVEPVELLDTMLFAAGEPNEEVGVTEPGRVRREFARQADMLTTLRDHKDAEVRALAERALALALEIEL